MHYKELMSDGFIKRVLGCSAFNTPLFGLKETMQFKGDLGKSLALELADPQDPSLLLRLQGRLLGPKVIAHTCRQCPGT